ncbi:MAG: PorP/SprF family type IX secretion system membrane protein [Bacteroidota bacterium]
MKKIVLLLLLGAVGFQLQAQLTEEAIFSHYVANHALVNPAAIGFNENSQAFMNIRRSAQNFPGSPTSYAISYNGAAGNVLGLGASIFSENIAQLTNFRFQGGVGLRFKVTDDIKVAGGLTVEISQRRLSNSILDNSFYEPGDQIVEANVEGTRYFDSSFGLYASYKENTYAGISFPNMVVSKLNAISTADDSTNTFLQSVSAIVGHKIAVSDDLTIEPSLMVLQLEDTPLRIDANLLAHFLGEQFSAGLAYRFLDAPLDGRMGGNAALLLGVKVTAFKIFYSYEVSFLDFQTYNNGSHEVTIAFDFKGGSDARARRRKF